MRFAAIILSLAAIASAQTPAGSTWIDLSAKRDKLTSFHQEFEVTQATKTATGSRSMKRQVTLQGSFEQSRSPH